MPPSGLQFKNPGPLRPAQGPNGSIEPSFVKIGSVVLSENAFWTLDRPFQPPSGLQFKNPGPSCYPQDPHDSIEPSTVKIGSVVLSENVDTQTDRQTDIQNFLYIPYKIISVSYLAFDDDDPSSVDHVLPLIIHTLNSM